MPSTPHFSARIVVFAFSLLLTVAATWLTLSLRETPANPLGWPRQFLERLFGALRYGGRERFYWTGVLLYSGIVTVLHFGGLHYDIYIAIEHWDYLTHVLSGAGVAMLFYLTFHLESPDRSLRWIVPGVLAFGAGFEVYEFVFKDFWYTWSLRYYVIDTLIDMVNNVLGSVLVVMGLRLGKD